MKLELKISKEIKEILENAVKLQVQMSYFTRELNLLNAKLRLLAEKEDIDNFTWELKENGKIEGVYKADDLSEGEREEIIKNNKKITYNLADKYKIRFGR